MKKLFKEFGEFINKGNALSLAIGVIIGGAFTTIVSTINTKIISPLIGLLLGGYNLAESEALMTVLKSHTEVIDGVETVVIDNAIYWGALIQAVIDFLLTAVVLFVIFKIVTFILNKTKENLEKVHELLNQNENENEVIEEAVEEIVEETPEVVMEPTPEVQLLTEIRDLLANKDK